MSETKTIVEQVVDSYVATNPPVLEALRINAQGVADLMTRAGAIVTHIAGVPQAFTEEEVVQMFIQKLHNYADYWAAQEGYDTTGKIKGALFSVLATLDGTSMDLPAFDLVIQTDDDDKEYLQELGCRFFENGMRIGGDLHDVFHTPNPNGNDLLIEAAKFLTATQRYTPEEVQALNENLAHTERLLGQAPHNATQFWEQRIISGQNPDPQVFTPEEISGMLAEKAHRIADTWLSVPHLGTKERVRGAVGEILRVFDGQDMILPGFVMRPANRQGEEEMLLQNGYRYFAPDTHIFGQLTEAFLRKRRPEVSQMLDDLEKPWRDRMPGLPPAQPPVLPLQFDAYEHRYVPVDNKLVNTVTGEEIPKDEPVFILRAKDAHALTVLMQYSARCTEEQQRTDMAELMGSFVKWRMKHDNKVKEPGSQD